MHSRLRIVRPVLAAIALGALILSSVACSGSDDDNADATIRVRGELLSYDPEGVIIDAGDTVEWEWDADGHSVTSGAVVAGVVQCTPDGVYDSGLQDDGDRFDWTFATAGTYGFYCKAPGHCAAFESGIITVQ